MAYALEHATRPATIGLVLSSSPLALLAWIGEKHLEWSDTDDIPLDKILSMVTLYWFTSSIARCIWPYRGIISGSHDPISTTKPLGYSAFKDITITPNAWSKYYPNMKFRKTHDKVRKSTDPVVLWPSGFICAHHHSTGRTFCGVGAARGFSRGRRGVRSEGGRTIVVESY